VRLRDPRNGGGAAVFGEALRGGAMGCAWARIREASAAPASQGELGGAECSGAVLDFIASTATLDRYHEVIEPAGWRLDAYRRNPVFQNAHNYGDVLFTLGKALSTEVRTVAGGEALCQRIQFATEVNPVARIAYGLYRGGFLNAVSVGFVPLRWEDPPSPGGSGAASSGPRRRYLEQELLEVSAVAIPANPDALALGLKSGAIGKGDLQATVDLLRALVGTASPEAGARPDEWLDLAREFWRVMRKA
jgi:phage head maturation protease